MNATNHWEEVTFALLFQNVTSSHLKLSQKRYAKDGAYIVVDQGEAHVGGYTDDVSLVHPSSLPVLIFGDHTRCVKYVDRPFVQGADGVKVLVPSQEMLTSFTFWILDQKARDIRNKGYARHFADLRKESFLIPPLPEQHRIVEAIESYLTRLDDAVTTLERVQRNLKRYRTSVLKAAVEGRLVPTEVELARKENREYEPASVLLARILKERKRRFIEDAAEKGRAKAEAKANSASKAWTDADDEKTLAAGRAKAAKKYQEPTAPDASELPELPEGWCWAAVDQIAAITGGLTKNANRDSLPLHVPYLRVANVYADELRLDEMKEIGVTPQERDRTLLEIGDLLIVEGNGSVDQIGRVALWDGSISGCCHQNHLIKARLIDTDLVRWSLQWLLSPEGRKAIVRQASSTSGLHTLSISKISGLPIPFAPKIEITRISVEVDRLISLAENSADIASTTLKRTKRFRQSILKWAFEGKLVDQDPNDEPASALLERIKAERSASKPSTKATRSSRKRKTA